MTPAEALHREWFPDCPVPPEFIAENHPGARFELVEPAFRPDGAAAKRRLAWRRMRIELKSLRGAVHRLGDDKYGRDLVIQSLLNDLRSGLPAVDLPKCRCGAEATDWWAGNFYCKRCLRAELD